MRHPVNNGHFNAKANGAERRGKRGMTPLGKANLKDIENLLPYNFAF